MKKKLRLWSTAACIVLLPSSICSVALRLIGHKIANKVYFGFSLVLVEELILADGARIGHLNFIKVISLKMGEGAYVGIGNLIYGPMLIVMDKQAAIGNQNKISRGQLGTVVNELANLTIGENSKITSRHLLDCTQSIFIGMHSTLAGCYSQIWTHGYVHDETGSGRYRLDGSVTILNNVYIGSASIITAGVEISDAVIVGAGTTVASGLLKKGLYVSASLRYLERPIHPDFRDDLTPVCNPELCEKVYIKKLRA